MTDLSPFINFLKTPPLWKGIKFEITQFIFPEMDLKHFLPKPFPKRRRLGHQMEHVFHQLLSHAEDYEVLIYNLPIQNDERTLGEIDFILKNHLSKELIHVELTYKFYLVDTSFSTSVDQLIGPNRKDAFFHKMEKIRDKQFQLVHSPDGIRTLEEYNIDHTAMISQACFKAQLFLPYQSENRSLAHINSDCIVGFWISAQEFDTIRFSEFQYYMPFKSAWVLAPNDNVSWESHQEILLEINLKIEVQIAPMIWIKKSETEFEKCFIVWW